MDGEAAIAAPGVMVGTWRRGAQRPRPLPFVERPPPLPPGARPSWRWQHAVQAAPPVARSPTDVPRAVMSWSRARGRGVSPSAGGYRRAWSRAAAPRSIGFPRQSLVRRAREGPGLDGDGDGFAGDTAKTGRHGATSSARAGTVCQPSRRDRPRSAAPAPCVVVLRPKAPGPGHWPRRVLARPQPLTRCHWA